MRSVTVQPCGHCGNPVLAGPGRSPGQIWWHTDRADCLRARWRANHPRPPARSQPCGHCGRAVQSAAGRRPGLVWWHRNEECQRARVRLAKSLYRARRTDRQEAA